MSACPAIAYATAGVFLCGSVAKRSSGYSACSSDLPKEPDGESGRENLIIVKLKSLPYLHSKAWTFSLTEGLMAQIKLAGFFQGDRNSDFVGGSMRKCALYVKKEGR